MKGIYVTPSRNKLNEIPVRGQDGRYIRDDVNADVQTEKTNLTFLRNVYDKVVKLEAGEPDSKKKAKLIEIATRNLNDYFKNNGSADGFITQDNNGKTITDAKGKKLKVTCTELQKRLAPYQR